MTIPLPKNFLEYTRAPEEIIATATRMSEEHHRDSGVSPAVATRRVAEILGMIEKGLSAETQDAVALADLDRIIGLLREERYVDGKASPEGQSGLKAAVRKLYYAFRPFFPVAFRKHLQRIALRGWDSRKFPSWPVDFSTENLVESIWRRLLVEHEEKIVPFIWFWPEGYSSACMMTHDVETEAGRNFCSTMMEMERRRGIVSAFEVVPEERYSVPEEFLEEIRSRGCEVCIHGLNHDGHLFSTREIFTARATKINQYAEKWQALGFRSPVLYRNLDWLPDLKFSYDMSVPNVGHLDPQPGGCCTVMPYFIGNILELPLTTTQDYSLFNILQQRSLDLWKQQITSIRGRNGLISFIIHPDYVNESWSSELYDRLLEYLAELRSNQNVWIALPREISDWWRARHKMKLVNKDGGWQIVGDQSGRARIAFASLEAGQLVYSFEQTPNLSRPASSR